MKILYNQVMERYIEIEITEEEYEKIKQRDSETQGIIIERALAVADDFPIGFSYGVVFDENDEELFDI